MIVKVDANSVSISASGAVTANICIEYADGCFPAPAWNDFILVVLKWFNSALSSFVLGGVESYLIDFMDGPYAIEIRGSVDKDEIKLIGLSGDGRRKLKFIAATNTRKLCLELLKASDEILEKLKNLNFSSEDSQELEGSARQLRRALLRINP